MAEAPATRIAVAVVEWRGRFLVGVRAEDVSLPGFWEFPGGKVEPAETPQQAAARECLEETGLAVRVVGEYPAVTHSYDHGQLALRFFDCRPLDPAAEPRPPFCWRPRGELAAHRFPPANRALIEQLTGSPPVGLEDDKSV